MKYIKIFENFNNFKENDIVVCCKSQVRAGIPPFLSEKILVEEGKKYKILKIVSTVGVYGEADVQDIETDKIIKGISCENFKLEFEFDANKYNL